MELFIILISTVYRCSRSLIDFRNPHTPPPPINLSLFNISPPPIPVKYFKSKKKHNPNIDVRLLANRSTRMVTFYSYRERSRILQMTMLNLINMFCFRISV